MTTFFLGLARITVDRGPTIKVLRFDYMLNRFRSAFLNSKIILALINSDKIGDDKYNYILFE